MRDSLIGVRWGISISDVGKKAPCTPKVAPSWPNERRGASKWLELGCTRFLTVVLEIPAKIEYIDFGWPPERIRIAKIGGIRPAGASELAERAALRPIIWMQLVRGRRRWHVMPMIHHIFGRRQPSSKPWAVLSVHWPSGCTQKSSTSALTIVKM